MGFNTVNRKSEENKKRGILLNFRGSKTNSEGSAGIHKICKAGWGAKQKGIVEHVVHIWNQTTLFQQIILYIKPAYCATDTQSSTSDWK